MARHSDFFAQYKRPEWQRKRLEVMERAGFECEECGVENQELQIHHTYYEKDRKPWDYPSESLQCLCEPCHRKAQKLYEQMKRQLGKLATSQTYMMLGYGLGLEMESYDDVRVNLLDYDSPAEVLMGIGHVWGLTDNEIYRALDRDQCISGWKLNELKKAKQLGS